MDAVAERDLTPGLAYWGRKQLEGLKAELRDSEELLQIAWTTSRYFATWIFALTDQRVICLRKLYFLHVVKVRTIALEEIVKVDENRDGGVMTIYPRFDSGGSARFMFGSEAENRETILQLLRLLPERRRAKLRRHAHDNLE